MIPRGPSLCIALSLIACGVMGCIPRPTAPLGYQPTDDAKTGRPPVLPSGEPSDTAAAPPAFSVSPLPLESPATSVTMLADADRGEAAPAKFPTALPDPSLGPLDRPRATVTPPMSERPLLKPAPIEPPAMVTTTNADPLPPPPELAQHDPRTMADALVDRPVLPPTDPLATYGSPNSQVPLIPRDVFFAPAERSLPRVSPDGKWLAFIGLRDGAANIYVAPINDLERSAAWSHETTPGISDYFWAFTSRHVLYFRNEATGGHPHLIAASGDTGEVRDLTPIPQASARLLGMSERFPAEILVGLNDRPPGKLFDIHRINLITGAQNWKWKTPVFPKPMWMMTIRYG